jgi:hypothetical protein
MSRSQNRGPVRIHEPPAKANRGVEMSGRIIRASLLREVCLDCAFDTRLDAESRERKTGSLNGPSEAVEQLLSRLGAGVTNLTETSSKAETSRRTQRARTPPARWQRSTIV